MSGVYEDKDRLEKLHIEEGKSVQEISELFGVSHTTILKKMQEFGVDIQTHPSKPYHNEEKMRELYTDMGKSMAEIAEQFNVSRMTISNWIDKHNIEKREMADCQIRYTKDQLFSYIEDYVEENGRAPATSTLSTWEGPCLRTYQNRFGSLTNAIREAGYTPRSEEE